MRGVIDHFSYSQLSTFLACPLQYRFRYVELIPPAFTTSALVFGSSIHEAVAAFHQQHLIGDTLRPDQMLDVYRASWASRNGEEIRYCNGFSHPRSTQRFIPKRVDTEQRLGHEIVELPKRYGRWPAP